MLNAILPDTLLFIFYLLYVVFLIKRKKLILNNHLLLFLMVVYVLAVISVTLFPLPIQRSYIVHMIKNKFGEHNNFIPFHSIADTLRTAVAGSVILRQIGGNVLLLSPFGFLFPLLVKNMSFKKTILVGLSFSVIIESLQYLISAVLGFSYRSTDIDDVILNTTGACLGYLALRLILKVFVSNKLKHSNLQSSSGN